MPQFPIQQWMVAIPTLDEVRLAVSLLSSGKAPGADGIHPEIIQHSDQKLLEALHKTITTAWDTKTVPQDWQNAQLITLFKKGDIDVYARISVAYHSSPSQVKCSLEFFSTDCRNSLRMFYLKPSVASVPDKERYI